MDASHGGGQGRVAIARIVRAHGIRGEVRAELLTDFPERFASLRAAYVGEAKLPTAVQWARLHKGGVLLKLQGVDSMNDALGLVGQIVSVDRRDAAPLPEGQHYVFELEGLPVVDEESGRVVGRLARVERNPAHDLFVVERPDGEERLVPAVRALVAVDLAEKVIRVRAIEGLLS